MMKKLILVAALAMGAMSLSAAKLSPDQAWERARAEAASKGMHRVASSGSVKL